MNVMEAYNEYNRQRTKFDGDYQLISATDKVFVGSDKDNNAVVVVKGQDGKASVRQKTSLLCLECNAKVTLNIENHKENDTVHILKCLSKKEQERLIFMELANVIVSSSDNTELSLLNAFQMLQRFFKDERSISEQELIGLYGELLAIRDYSDKLPMVEAWQSKDKMKFDFSFTSDLKLEVKTTRKPERKHHFLHEQLCSDNQVYIFSYMLREDDDGKSLYDLILECKPLFEDNVAKMMRLDIVLKNVEQERLQKLRFSETYTNANRKIFDAKSVPKFDGDTPNGVSDATYDSNLDMVESIDDGYFLIACKNAIENGDE